MFLTCLPANVFAETVGDTTQKEINSEETNPGETLPGETEPTPAPTPKELAQQKAIMKVYRKYQQREYERIKHPAQFPSDYFFSALAELVLDD